MRTSNNLPISEFHPKLVCGLLQLIVDFRTNQAQLIVPKGHCSDMTGTINLVKRVNPAVEVIEVTDQQVPLKAIVYFKVDDCWEARKRPE